MRDVLKVYNRCRELWDVLKRLHRCRRGITTPQATRLQAKQLAKVGIVIGGRLAMLWSACQ
jgi:hypothetical protein